MVKFAMLMQACVLTQIQNHKSKNPNYFNGQFDTYSSQMLIFNCVARALPGGRAAHLEGQEEDENVESLRKNKNNWRKFEEKWESWNSCPLLDCEAGYAPAYVLAKW